MQADTRRTSAMIAATALAFITVASFDLTAYNSRPAAGPGRCANTGPDAARRRAKRGRAGNPGRRNATCVRPIARRATASAAGADGHQRDRRLRHGRGREEPGPPRAHRLNGPELRGRSTVTDDKGLSCCRTFQRADSHSPSQSRASSTSHGARRPGRPGTRSNSPKDRSSNAPTSRCRRAQSSRAS